jgi:hypothetical protein
MITSMLQCSGMITPKVKDNVFIQPGDNIIGAIQLGEKHQMLRTTFSSNQMITSMHKPSFA